jgi:hypothetical protein
MSVMPLLVQSSQGCIDFLSYMPSLDGWIAGGWIGLGWDDQDASPQCALEFGDSTIQETPRYASFRGPGPDPG